jgi:hypothetical protein
MQKTSKKRTGQSKTEERMKTWVDTGEARGIHFEYLSRSAGGAVGVVIFADGEDVINFNTYALSEAPRTLKKYYALSHGVLEGGAKERAIKACLDEMDAPDFADNHSIFAKKGADLIDYVLQMRVMPPSCEFCKKTRERVKRLLKMK